MFTWCFCRGLGLWAGGPEERKGSLVPFACDGRGAAEQQKCLDSKILPIQPRTKRCDLNMTEVLEELLVSLKLFSCCLAAVCRCDRCRITVVNRKYDCCWESSLLEEGCCQWSSLDSFSHRSQVLRS